VLTAKEKQLARYGADKLAGMELASALDVLEDPLTGAAVDRALTEIGQSPADRQRVCDALRHIVLDRGDA
jgi:hypothetical protein